MISLRDIRRQIQSVRKISHITRAMKTVSAIRLMKVQGQVVRQRPYARKLRDVLADLITRTKADSHPFLSQPITNEQSGGKTSIVCLALGSDRGLCGPFNSNLVSEIQRFLVRQTGHCVELQIAGKKLRELLRTRRIKIDKYHADLQTSKDRIKTLGEELKKRYLQGDISELWCIYTEFRSSSRQQVTSEMLLPICASSLTDATLFPEYHYEPDVHSVLNQVLPMFFSRQWHRVFMESEASEHATRMRAMDMATVNAGDMIDQLTMVLNKARQELITRELSEISTAAEAVR